MAHASFNGLRVLSLESRRAKEVEKLIRTYGGEPIVVPAMREVGLESNQQALEFASGILAGSYDLVIFMTGVGVRAMLEIVQTRFDREEFLTALRKVKIAARGAKPASVLRELKIPVDVTSEEPSTWREVLQAIDAAYGDSLRQMHVAVQEYGASNPELLAELNSRSRELTKVPVYQWALPEDLQPLRECVLGLLNGMVDVVLSIGPTTSEELEHYGIEPDFEPSRPRSRVAGVRRVAASTSTMAGFRDGLAEMDFLHEISSRMAAADSLHLVLDRIVDFITSVIPCDSCFIYVLEGENLMLRASKNPHADLIDHIRVEVGQGVTGWVAKHRQPVAIASAASNDPRFKAFKNIPEDHFEAMLCTPILCAGRVVGVINLQHRMSYRHTNEQVRLLSTLGFLVGAEIERARLETENTQLTSRLETRKAVDRAKSVLQRDLSLNEEDAYQMMQKESRQRRKSMREIAEAILLAEDLRRGRSAN